MTLKKYALIKWCDFGLPTRRSSGIINYDIFAFLWRKKYPNTNVERNHIF